MLTNGRQLRLLRDSSALATASYVEFDLEAIFDGELFSEFVLLYRLLHVSRFAVADGAAPSTCWLEKWRTEAISSGVRALEQLRKGVQDAITTLGTGFLRQPDNSKLREAFDAQAFHNALLRLAYRLLFLFVAEDRGALHPRGTSDEVRERYAKYFSSARLRGLARRRRGSAHSDLYQALRIVLDALGDENGRPELGLPGLGGIFDTREADEPLEGLSLSNEYLLTAVRHLSQVRDAGSRRWRSVDYRNLDAEELGSIYESLLELVPKHSAVDRTFELFELPGNARKTTGSYYTPSSLIECLLDSALDPVVDDAVKRGEQSASAAGQPDPSDAIVKELLSLAVCDPACGSGHFLVAAARRLAKRVAAVRERNPEPTVDAVRRAMREVVARCIYGVDLNPMAVELAKVSLWMEALEPGKPLTFLDAHIKHGNALIGATPALLKNGIPDEAFKPIEGDDKKFAKGLEKQNAHQRGQQLSFFDFDEDAKVANTVFAQSLRRIMSAPSNDLKDVHGQEAAYRDWLESSDYRRAQHIADAWCAAFMWTKAADAPPAVTHGIFRALNDPDASAAAQATHDEIVRLREQYTFFHWHLEFPEVFEVSDNAGGVDSTTGWRGGFSCMLGNPPWGSLKLQEKEYFADISEIANASTSAARKREIANLAETRPDLYASWVREKDEAERKAFFCANSRRYPLCGHGDLDTFALFGETARSIAGPDGAVGLIVPSNFLSDLQTAPFTREVIARGELAGCVNLDNRRRIFPGIGEAKRFSLLALLRGGNFNKVQVTGVLFEFEQLDLFESLIELPYETISKLNPTTGTLPSFRSPREGHAVTTLYQRAKILAQSDWGTKLSTQFHMSGASDKFTHWEAIAPGQLMPDTNDPGPHIPDLISVYEAKFFHQYDHRFKTFGGIDFERRFRRNPSTNTVSIALKESASYQPVPRYWMRASDAEAAWPSKRQWALGLRAISNTETNQRTAVCSFLPKVPTGHSLWLITGDSLEPEYMACIAACINSIPFDFALRQKMPGTNISAYILNQLPVIQLATFNSDVRSLGGTVREWVQRRVLELTYTAYDMAPFASDLGDTGGPFRWDEGRRAVIRAELDALFFHLYGASRDDVDYITETFPIVKRKDEAKYGTYRTKELILAEYDRMAAAGVSLTNPLIDGENYNSTLNPPPGHGPRHPAAPV